MLAFTYKHCWNQEIEYTFFISLIDKAIRRKNKCFVIYSKSNGFSIERNESGVIITEQTKREVINKVDLILSKVFELC